MPAVYYRHMEDLNMTTTWKEIHRAAFLGFLLSIALVATVAGAAL